MSKRNFDLSAQVAAAVAADDVVLTGDEVTAVVDDAVAEVQPSTDATPDAAMGIGAVARKLILANKTATNKQVLERIQKLFPAAKTTGPCIAWYRNDLIKKGLLEAGAKRNLQKVVVTDADFVL